MNRCEAVYRFQLDDKHAVDEQVQAGFAHVMRLVLDTDRNLARKRDADSPELGSVQGRFAVFEAWRFIPQGRHTPR